VAAQREVKIQIDDSFTAKSCNFAVGFLKFEDNGREAAPAGTGTFARVGQTSGIITAGHVLKNLPDQGEIGLVRFPTIEPALQNFRLNMAHCDHVLRWNGEDGSAPDLGFLGIPEVVARDLEAKGAVFYNLTRKREFSTRDKDHVMAKAYALVGVVAEWAEVVPGDVTKGLKKIVGGLFGAVKSLKAFVEDETDLLDVEIDYSSSPRIPKSYEGVSGGALWELHVELLGQKVVEVNTKLHGIAFRQSEDHSVVTCDTETAIDKLVEDVVAKWNNQAI